MIVPELDKNFRPIILEIRKFNDDVAKDISTVRNSISSKMGSTIRGTPSSPKDSSNPFYG